LNGRYLGARRIHYSAATMWLIAPGMDNQPSFITLAQREKQSM
jgi:hypothetical protein